MKSKTDGNLWSEHISTLKSSITIQLLLILIKTKDNPKLKAGNELDGGRYTLNIVYLILEIFN